VKLLKDILYKVAIEAVKGTTDNAVNKIEFDSRKVQENDVFVAIRGTVSDGHDFIEKAINLGAIVIVCETLPQFNCYGNYLHSSKRHQFGSWLLWLLIITIIRRLN
jgi:UDP-N-acetylmuramyl pentapeptide synthase